MKKGQGYEKIFQYKGQMINYYNRARKNPAIDFIVSGLNKEGQYFCFYTYKKN